MFLATDTEPELTLLDEEIEASREADDSLAIPQSERAVLLAVCACRELLLRASSCRSDAERAFEVRDGAISSVAEIVVAATRSPLELQLIREDLARCLSSHARSATAASAYIEPRFEPGAAVLMALVELGSAAEGQLAMAETASRAGLLEDLTSFCAVLLGLAWRLRAWAARETEADGGRTFD